MAQWRKWNTSNLPDTCLWCGKALRQGRGDWIDDPNAKDGRRFDMDAPKSKKGDYGDGFFCGLRCGYQFGEQMAEFKHRLNPVPNGEN